MTSVATYFTIDGEHIAESVNQAREKLTAQDQEAVVDFSGVLRMDTSGLHATESLCDAADAKSVRLTLRGVNVGVYKVLKLARLTARFTIAN
jgi:anti-anti-sigma regulatory factor